MSMVFSRFPKGFLNPQTRLSLAKSCKKMTGLYLSFMVWFLSPSIPSLTTVFLLTHCTTANLTLSVPKHTMLIPASGVFCLSSSLLSSSSHDKLRSNVTSSYGLSLISQSKQSSLVTFYHMCSLLRLLQIAA